MGSTKYVYFFGAGEADGSAKMKNSLGGKGATQRTRKVGHLIPAGGRFRVQPIQQLVHAVRWGTKPSEPCRHLVPIERTNIRQRAHESRR